MLLKQNESPIKITRKYGFSKQLVSYYRWKLKNNIVNKGTRKKKISDEDLKYIIDLSKNKTTSFMGARRIARIINARLAKKRWSLYKRKK